MEAIRQLLFNCTRAFVKLSVSTTNSQQVIYDPSIAKQIVLKLKELKNSLGDIWPFDMLSFCRDIFDVGQYQVEAAEFFHPVPFYSNISTLVKLYRWSVYDANGTVICRYHLERSEMIPGTSYHVLGKSYSTGHCQLQPYEGGPPDYNQMKIHMINDLTGQGPGPLMSLSVPRFNF